MTCEECGDEMELVHTINGEHNGCDVDVDIYRCPTCGVEVSD